MRAFTSHLKRCLALLLAVVLMVPAMSLPAFASEEHIHNHAETNQTLSQLIVSNYGDVVVNGDYQQILAAEKVILNSGALVTDPEFEYEAELGTGNVALDAVAKSVTAAVVEDAEHNCVWIPVSAGVYVDGVEKEQVALALDPDSGDYVGYYTFDGSAFYVVVNYNLVKTLTEEEKTSIVTLLNIAYELSNDLTTINALTSDATVSLMGSGRDVLTVLNALTDTTVGSAMGLADGETIVDLLYSISTGSMSQSFDLPFEFYGSNIFEVAIEFRSGNNPAVASALDLKTQQDTNGGKLDLTQFVADHSLISYLELAGKHGADLDTLIADLYSDLDYLSGNRGLTYTVGELEIVVEDDIPALKEAAVDWVNEQLTAMQANYPDAGIELIDDLSDLATVVENLQAERDGMLNLINKQLKEFKIDYPDAELIEKVETVSDMETLNGQLETIYNDILTQADAAAKSVNPLASVSSKADLEAIVAQLGAMAPAELADMIDALTALEEAMAALDDAIVALPLFDDAIANMQEGMKVTEVDALTDTLDAMKALETVLADTCAGLDPVVDYAGNWVTGTYISSEDSAVYTGIMSAVAAAAKAGTLRWYTVEDIADELVIAQDTDQANMSMSDITITITLDVVDATNNFYTHSLKKVITVANGTTDAELLPAVEAFEAEALAQWTAAGIYVDGKYKHVVTSVPSVVEGNDEATVSYDPEEFAVTYVYGDTVQVPYGTTVTLPAHANNTMAYDYFVNGTHYMQGSSIVVKDALTIDREEGEAYTAVKVFPLVSARFDDYLEVIGATTDDAAAGIERVKAIMTSGALGIENQVINVRYPKNCVAIAEGEGNEYTVTANTYEASPVAQWLPVSVTVFEGDTSRDVTDYVLDGGVYVFTFTSNTLDHVQVNYELDLVQTGLSEDDMKTTMNEIMEVYNDVVDQLNDMNSLTSKLEYLEMMNKTVLDTAKGLTENEDTIAAIDQMIANNLDANGNMKLVAYLNNYLTGSPKGLQYYYANFQAIDAEVQSLKDPMEILGADTALLDELDNTVSGAGDKVGAVTAEIVAIDLTGPDENLNNVGLNYLLNAIGPATNSNEGFSFLPYLEEGDALPGDELVLETALTLAGPGMVQVVINLTAFHEVKDTTVNVTVTPAVLNKDGELTSDQINALVAAVEAFLAANTDDSYEGADNPNTVEEEAVYSEAALRELLAGEKAADQTINYYWVRYHDHEYTIATCTQAPYCVFCGEQKPDSTPDTVNGHTWDSGVVSLAPTCEKTGLTLFTCSECGGTYTEEIAALGHTFGEYTSDGDVTCSTYGHKTAYCQREGCNVYDRVVDYDTALLPHEMGEWQNVDATYHTRTCLDCDYSEIDVHGWDEGVIYPENEPTCYAPGTRIHTCTECDATKQTEVAQLEHDFSGSPSGIAAARNEYGHQYVCIHCGEPGGARESHTYGDLPCDEKGICSICAYIKPAGTHTMENVTWVYVDENTHQAACPECEDIVTDTHSYTSAVTTEPTHTVEGERTFTCVCGHSYTEEIPATGHTYTTVVTAPTCTEQGYTTYTCTCDEEGNTYVDNYVDPTGHSYGAWSVSQAPTCEEPGEQYRVCSKCGDRETEEIDATGHTYGDWYQSVAPTCTEKGEERRDCACGHFETREVEATGHSYTTVVTDPTCTEQGYTTYTCACGDSYVDNYVDATGHSYGEWEEYDAATCSKKGEERRYCACGDFESREIPMVDHEYTSGIFNTTDEGHSQKCAHCDAYGPVIAHTWNTTDCEAADGYCTVCNHAKPAAAHSWSAWADDGNNQTHSRYCQSNCGVENEVMPHIPKNEGTVTQEPTCSEPGVLTHTCFDCGATYTVAIDPTGVHVYDETVDPIVVDEPDCEGVGEGYYECIYGCGETKTVEIPALGHDYQVTGVYDDNGHEVECSRCHDIQTVDHEWVAVGTPVDFVQHFECACGAEKDEEQIPFVPDEDYEYEYTFNNNTCELKVDLPDNGGNMNYALKYTILLGYYNAPSSISVYSLRARSTGTPIVVEAYVEDVENLDFLTLNLKAEVAARYPEFFGGTANASALESFMRQVKNNWATQVSITCELIDLSKENLLGFVVGLNSGSSDSLRFSLVQNADGSYTIVANVSDAASIQAALMEVVTALVMENDKYSKIGLKSHAANGDYEFFYGDSKLSLQALINGILYKDGFGSESIINAFDSNGNINPDAIQDYDTFLVNRGVGALLQTAYMSLGNDEGIEHEVEFHLTISQGMSQLGTVRDALETLKPVVTIETVDGKMQITLKEKVYEAYLAEMMLTGEIDKASGVVATTEDACQYLYDYLTVLTADGVTADTYMNTLGKVGLNVDLTSYEKVVNLLINELSGAQVSNGSVVLELSRNGKTTLDKLISTLGVNVSGELLNIIKEYNDPALSLGIEMTAAFEPAQMEFEAVIIDPYYGSFMDKADYVPAGSAADRIANLGGTAAVMLLDDITGDLTFNHTTILDLNGKTITGNIVANDKLFIVDSSMDTAVCGMVNGAVTAGANGTIYITGGKYRDTLSESYLKNGYVQDSNNVVVNELYSIAEDAEGEYTITLHSDFSTKPSQDMGLALGIDLLTDMMLNGFDSAAMTITGDEAYEVYNITLNDLIALYAGADLTDAAISAVLEDVDFENIRLFINNLLASVLNFEIIAGTYEDADSSNDGVVAKYSVITNNWDVIPEHVVDEDYIEFHLEANTAVSETATLTFVVDGEMAEALFPELGEVAEATATVNTLNVEYGDKTFDIGLAGNANVTINLTNSEEKHDTYVAVIAVVLAKAGNTKLLTALNDGGDRNAQWDAFNDVSVKDVVSALKAINANTNFADLAAEVGLTAFDSTEMDTLNTAYQTLGYTAGALLTRLGITGSSTQKMGALDPDGDGSYVFDDYATAAYTNSLSRSVYGFTADVDGAMTAKLTLKLFGDPNTYTITWKNWDDTVLHTDTVAYKATTPEYDGPTPTKEADAQYTYTFAGWDPAPAYTAGVTANATYTATYTQTAKNTVTFTLNEACTYYVDGVAVTEDNNPFTFVAGSTFDLTVKETSGYIIEKVVIGDLEKIWASGDSEKIYEDVTVSGNMTISVTADKEQNTGGGGYVYTCSCHCKDSNCRCFKGCHAKAYDDLKDNLNTWYHTEGYVDYMICKGYMIGVSETEWAPDMNMTRAMVVTTLYRLEKQPEVTGNATDYYTDVMDGTWYSNALIWATTEGLVEGYGNNLFGPNDVLTREQLATMFYRYAAHKGKNITFSESLNLADIYSDGNAISWWAEDGATWAYAKGLIVGPGDGVYVPKGIIRRCDFAALLSHWCWGKFNV